MSETLVAAFSALCERRATAPALLQGTDEIAFAAWSRRAGEVASWLAASGLARGERVVVWMDASAEMAAVILGAWAAGAIITLVDTRSQSPQIEHVLAVTGARLVIQGDRPLPGPVATPVVRAADLRREGAALPRPPLPTEPASIVFTSGSTGRAKGVTQSHGNLVRGARTVNGTYGLDERDRIVVSVPWCFDYGIMQLHATLVTGALLVIPPQPTPFALCDAIERHRPTLFPGTPALFGQLLQPITPFTRADLSSVRLVTTTGGRVAPAMLAAVRRLFPTARLFLNYGLTETYRSAYLDPDRIDESPGALGKAIDGVELVVVREDGTLAAPGEQGEIVHRGDGVFLGYWGDAVATARALRPDPFAPPGLVAPPNVVFTGDIGLVDEQGLLHYVGRRDRQLKAMGARVSPEEVEELVCASGFVDQAAVFGRPHELLGHEIWAAVVPKHGEADVLGRLPAYARRAMAPPMIPRRFLLKEALPRLPSGKVDYGSLAAEADALCEAERAKTRQPA